MRAVPLTPREIRQKLDRKVAGFEQRGYDHYTACNLAAEAYRTDPIRVRGLVAQERDRKVVIG